MAKTLVIKGANFTTNKLTTVTIADPVYCTGISLNKSTATLSSVGATETLTATVTPADCTEAISWSTSDSNVATVSNGTVTAVGVGTATITATCGSYSATCSVTVSVIMNNDAAKLAGTYIYGDTADSGGNGMLAYSSLASRGAMLSSTGTLHIHGDESHYAYVMPANTSMVKLTFTNTSDVTLESIFWLNHETALTGDYSSEMKLISKTGISNVTISGGVAIVSVPSISGFPDIDAIAVCLKKLSGDFASEDFAKVQVEFLPAA